MVRIAVTGGIASGKSLVGFFLRGAGVAICEADELAREVMRPGRDVYDRVVEAFGDSILASGGEIDRTALGDRVFGDARALSKLNTLTHAAVARSWWLWMKEQEIAGTQVAAVIVPLLHEAGFSEGWDATVCVVSPFPARIDRLKARGIDEAGALARIGAQWDDDRKAARCDYVIENDGSRERLKERTLGVLASILKRQE